MNETSEVRHDAERNRYEVLLDERFVGFAVYRRRDDRYVFTHTEISDDVEGMGLGSLLVRSALDDVRSSGSKVVPLCPFVAGWIDRHPEYSDLVDDDMLRMLRPPS